MDQQKFLELLQSVQIPNTETVKAATAELRTTYYPHSQSLLWLLQILTSHETAEVQQQAAVEALRLIPKHWPALPGDQKPGIREKLLQSTLAEEKSIVRHSIARVIASIAGFDLKDGEWESLPGLLVQACNSAQASHREVGVYIFFVLLESVGTEFDDKISGLFSLFQKTIKDPESAEVRINTMLCLGTLGMLMDSGDEENLAHFVSAFPAMVAVLKDTVDSKDEERASQAFEVFQNLLSCDTSLLNTHFEDLVNFMIDLAANTDLSEDSRSQALSFLMQCAKYRKMKIQGTKDMGENLTLKCLQIATEIDEEENDDDEVSPHKSALGLLDLLASGLPPRQVIVPLLLALPRYVTSDNPAYRQAGILALGMCVEGAPDFISTQLDVLMPVVFKLLNDPVTRVRYAALNGVARLADDLGDDLSKHHEQLIPALLKNLDASAQESNESEPKTLAFLKASCGALDSVTDSMDKQTLVAYVPELIPRLGRLLGHPDFSVKASAAGAIGSVAGSAEDAFVPYFETTMKALSSYVEMKASEEELDLRGTVCDAMGSIATAVGPAAFQPYVQPLMHASEEALHLGHPRLKETSYILWSVLAKVYEEEFTPFLEGVMKGLMECLNQEESDTEEIELGEHANDLVGQEVVIGGQKVKVVAPKSDRPDDLDEMEDEDDEDDWEDFGTVTAVAMEKEIAVEVIGDVLSHTRKNFVPYFEKTIETVVGLVEHSYEGVRKAAIGTLWRAYACLWALMEDHTGDKWSPGLPLKATPSGELIKLGEVVVTATLSVWEDEMDRAVVTDINRNVAATLKLCGPAILTQGKFLEQTTSIIASIITRSHVCQQDPMEDEPQEDMEDQESSEYDWLVIDTALDVVIGLSAALGDQFGELWEVFQKPVMKFASSQTNYERSTAIGTIAECTAHMGAAVTPFTGPLLTVHVHRLTDEDPETKSNAAYAVGLLIAHSTDSSTYLPSFNNILSKVEPLLHTQRARTLDNASGCVCRMIMAHQDKVPVDDLLPVLVDLLPLKEDYEENKPIFDCITGLYQQENSTVIGLTPKLLDVFTSVLGEPEEQLESETRTKIKETVKFIAQKNAALVGGNEKLMALMRAE